MWIASEMAAFAHVCDLRSFTAAARALGVPKVAVSRAIASLEKRLGTRLLVRTTRSVSLTPAGLLLRPHCARLLAEVEAVRSRFTALASGTKRLRVLTDAGYGRLLVAPLVPRFLEHYDGFELTVAVADSPPAQPSDWDLMICNGDADATEREGIVATRLGQPALLLCAAPSYLARHGRPRIPSDLNRHALLAAASDGTAAPSIELSASAAAATPTPADTPVESLPLASRVPLAPAPLRLRRGAEEIELRPRPALQANDPALVHSSTAAGLGIGVLPEFLCRQGLAAGKLQRVLPEWSLVDSLDLVALSPSASAGSAQIRQFLEFLLANMVPVLTSAAAG
jgi:LysR family transcriptional regulator, regulator for bpeEF and oprC